MFLHFYKKFYGLYINAVLWSFVIISRNNFVTYLFFGTWMKLFLTIWGPKGTPLILSLWLIQKAVTDSPTSLLRLYTFTITLLTQKQKSFKNAKVPIFHKIVSLLISLNELLIKGSPCAEKTKTIWNFGRKDKRTTWSFAWQTEDDLLDPIPHNNGKVGKEQSTLPFAPSLENSTVKKWV